MGVAHSEVTMMGRCLHSVQFGGIRLDKIRGGLFVDGQSWVMSRGLEANHQAWPIVVFVPNSLILVAWIRLVCPCRKMRIDRGDIPLEHLF